MLSCQLCGVYLERLERLEQKLLQQLLALPLPLPSDYDERRLRWHSLP
jgi:hypothetical protein